MVKSVTPAPLSLFWHCTKARYCWSRNAKKRLELKHEYLDKKNEPELDTHTDFLLQVEAGVGGENEALGAWGYVAGLLYYRCNYSRVTHLPWGMKLSRRQGLLQAIEPLTRYAPLTQETSKGR